MIKAVLFDYGGVLTEGGKLGSIRAMFARGYGVEPEGVKLDKSVEAACSGRIPDEDLVEAVNRLNPQYQRLTTSVFLDSADIYARSEPVYELAAKLRRAGIVTGIFSNVFATSAGILREAGCYEGFAPLFLSFEQHMMKPDQRLYEHVIEAMQLTPQEILFIDDKEEYLAPARALGMRTVLARSPEQIVTDVTVLFVQENSLRL